jgi:hypothetical protein
MWNGFVMWDHVGGLSSREMTGSGIASMSGQRSSKLECEPLCLPDEACLAQRWPEHLFRRCRLCDGL